MEFTIPQIEWMGREVKRQGDGPEYVVGMARGVEHAIRGAMDLGDIHVINHYVTLERTRFGYRLTPVRFRNGGASCNALTVPDAMETWWIHRPQTKDMIAQDETLVNDWIKQFLYIHPYEDGNGRTATILRNRFLCTINSPQDLPDYEW